MADLPAEIALAFDMHGCPNRCRHCWLRDTGNGGVDEATMRRIVGEFRAYTGPGGTAPHFQRIDVSPAFREPDFPADYRRLHELAGELGDDPAARFELLSVWRVARDDSYAAWAKSVGPDTCQITLFGGRETTDWFHQRRGAFDDAVLASGRLLDAGIKPRWQIFANTRGLAEIPQLLELAQRMKLPQRVAELGAEFDAFVHLWGPCGPAMGIEPLRPTVADLQTLPAELLVSTRRHVGRDVLWQSEGELLQAILARPEPVHTYGREGVSMPWLLITGSLDVYFNGYPVEPPWRLGNLSREPLSTVLGRFEQDDLPGLRLTARLSAQDLARRYGDPNSQRAFTSQNCLLTLYLTRHVQSGDALD